ncbi:hypothetical protein BWI93_11615 [Siphonobacter sp. BAB-5385]|uniref:hypothetical protein n=1 Tax=Siphonobacter sp. BAB-5385 TaxID=1864822 RepID=UPI000B9E52C9|nr:hypothetical protein [Siphonobacter sp. BAB-5385]OZI07996.1 hypothetical protein BWI93_11615 [Siphonobacter sp. BAB-5385]
MIMNTPSISAQDYQALLTAMASQTFFYILTITQKTEEIAPADLAETLLPIHPLTLAGLNTAISRLSKISILESNGSIYHHHRTYHVHPRFKDMVEYLTKPLHSKEIEKAIEDFNKRKEKGELLIQQRLRQQKV